MDIPAHGGTIACASVSAWCGVRAASKSFMKPAILSTGVLVLLTLFMQAQQPAAMPLPTVTARTDSSAKRTTTEKSGYTRIKEENRTLGVAVNVRFFAVPPFPYEVQAFFIAKDNTTRARTIFDAAAETSQNLAADFAFESSPLTGTTKSWTSIPISGTYSGTTSYGQSVMGNFQGSATSYSKTAGSNIEGWIVRVVAQGKVLRVDSNQQALKGLAEKQATEFDAAAGKIRKR